MIILLFSEFFHCIVVNQLTWDDGFVPFIRIGTNLILILAFAGTLWSSVKKNISSLYIHSKVNRYLTKKKGKIT